MPVYEYVCKDCGQKFDLLIGVTSDKTETKCVKCGSEKTERLFSGFSIGGSSDKSSSGVSCPTGTCPTSFLKEK